MYGNIPDVCMEYGIGIYDIKAYHMKWRKPEDED